MSLRDDIQAAGGLVSRAGLARRWGITEQRVHQLCALEGFPDPVPCDGLGRVRIYIAAECDAWRAGR